jgi:dinuclear metal center YbgI/SA1388 family protein
MKREELTTFLNSYLHASEFRDHCPNGLEVEGNPDIHKIATGVTASVELFEQAIEKKADTIIVHHGIIWDFETRIYKGGYRERVKLLLENNINLYGYHLPLDAHPQVGNNVQLCKLLKIQNIKPFCDVNGQYIGMSGDVNKCEKTVFFKRLTEIIERKPLIFDYGPDQISRVGVVSGAAQKYINQAVDAGLDVYITGEVSEHILHVSKEEKIHFISAGHYTTEKFGIKSLGKLLEDRFKLDVTFIDIPNPV